MKPSPTDDHALVWCHLLYVDGPIPASDFRGWIEEETVDMQSFFLMFNDAVKTKPWLK